MKQNHLFDRKAYRFKRFAKKAYSAFNSMHRVVNIGVVTGCMLTFAHSTPAFSQAIIEKSGDKVSEKELEEVTVTASRIETSASQAARLVTVITKSEIDRAPVKSIQDLLIYAAGVDVIQRGGHGVQADISIRGGSFDQTAILLNGINLSNPQTGHYSFDIPINLSDIDHIEIIHGPSSMVYGASAFSGGINIVTKKEPNSKAYLSAEAGSYGSFRVEGKGALTSDKLTNQLSLGYNRSDGYIANSDYDIINALWQSRLKVEESTIDFQLGYNDKKFGANTFYSPAYPNQYDKTSSYFASIRGETGKQLKFIPQIYWNRHHDEFQLIREGTANVPSWYKDHNYHRSDVYGANLNLQYTSKLGVTSFGSEFRNEGIYSSVLGKLMDENKGKFTKSDNRTNISHTLEHNLIIDRFSLSVGLLANHNTALKNGYKLYPAINTSYSILDELKVYASWNKATRMPTFTDLYYTTATHIGNSNLSPENSEAFELGFKYRNQIINAYVTGFLMKGSNMIDWIWNTTENKWASSNLTKIDRKGLEMGAKVNLHQLVPALSPITNLQVGYTRMHQKKKDDGLISNYAFNYLRDKFTAQLNHQIYKDITALWSFRYQKRMGEFNKYMGTDPAIPTEYPAFSTLDLKVNWKLKDFNIYVSANNIYNTDYYDLGNIPQAGFWFSSGVSYTFR